ncbi:MAG: hypothetical protein ACSLEX_00515 [Minisyncoccota bacterium]
MIGEKYQFSGQSENRDEQSPVLEDFLDRNLIAEKIIISRAAATERLGSANLHLTAENLYTSLYEPEKTKGLVGSNLKYPDRLAVFGAPLHSQPKKIPSREEFIATVKHAFTRETDFAQCFSGAAREQFCSVVSKSESTVLWTEGDNSGVPEYGLPGSHEQIRKVADAKFFNRIRREIALNRGGVKPSDVLLVVATEGKMKFIPSIVEKFERKGIETVVVVEDRLKNLISASDLIRGVSDMEIFSVLVSHYNQAGDHSKNMNEVIIPDSIHVIDSISDLSPFLEMESVFSRGKKVGTIFDMDGVLSDDELRKKLQTKAVIDALRRNGWI